ncbi:MAG TPA: histidine kinase dimerization/phospho-acceptor domain-containing protein, partial [Blastocatellia bacterium]|nr:histidine kinase dimerization/phospho-acceptor domain-containing protein [Blastocatellia bacterium]
MNRLKTFFKRHALLTGVLAVTFPLLFILYLQYRSLVTLETTLPVYRKEIMRDYLRAVSEESASFYIENSDRVLNVPADAITNRVGGIIQGKEKNIALKATTRVADFFSQQEFKGAWRYFIVVDTEYEGVSRNAVLFYNPERKAMEFHDDAPEWRAINVACASYLVYIRAGAEGILARPMGVDRDPMHPLIVKAIRDESLRIVAVAGMTVDQDFFTMEYFPEVIQKHLPEYFPTDHQQVVVAVNLSPWESPEEAETPIIGTEQVKKANAEASQPLMFIFQRWFLMMRHKMGEQWARRSFIINISLWSVMTLFLIGAVVMTLRTASRSMKLSEMKSDFVSNVSHELRTPLASIRVFGEFFKLGRVKEPEKMREYGEYIEAESRRLTQLINNILDFSKIESAEKKYRFGDTDIADLVGHTVSGFEVPLRDQGVKIAFSRRRA